ncbi:MAG TPA: hypothetical protein VE861_01960, partial [Gemmatimonadaceae bacterium]|nr:hypothetical protein [Gemmatimonadaceae bacterium]
LGLFAYVQAPTIRRRMHSGQATFTSRVDLVKSAWRVRRRLVQRRIDGATPAEREKSIELMMTAGRLDVGHAIWTGESDILNAVRHELQVTDTEFSLDGRMAAIGGAGLAARRMSQDLHCMSRSMLQVLRGER